MFTYLPENTSPLQYFTTFLPDNFVDKIVQNTNLYSVQRDRKGDDANPNEVKTFITMNIVMGIIKLPQYYNY